jgi:hypothetical protein
MLFRPLHTFGDAVEDELAGSDSSALAQYGPTAVTTPSTTSAPYFGPDINPQTGQFVMPSTTGLIPISPTGPGAPASPSWGQSLVTAFTSSLGTGVGAAIQNLFKPAAPKPAAAPQSSSNMLMTVGLIGGAVVLGALLLRRRSA